MSHDFWLINSIFFKKKKDNDEHEANGYLTRVRVFPFNLWNEIIFTISPFCAIVNLIIFLKISLICRT